ncbi:hypothetical protein YC2023_044040 [Brassica napus]
MRSRAGHILPGFAFLALGLWHLFNNIKLFCLRPNTFISSPWFPVSKIRHLELYFMMFSASASISMELFIGPRRHHPFDSDGTIPSNHLHNLIVSFHFKRYCLAQELFGEPCEIFKYSFSRSVGCFIHDENSHQGVKCSTEEALHKAKSLVYIEFSWLFVINTIFVVTLYMILDRVYGENVEYSSLTSNYQREQYDEEQQHFESESTQKMSFVQMGKFDDHGDKM